MDQTIRRMDATAQAALVASGQVTAFELLEAAIEAADATDLGSIIPIRFDALARARSKGPLAGPFAGVPFLLKDLGQEFAGQPNTAGSSAFRDRVPAAHSYYTRRCVAAGLVIFGRTATPELGLRAVTESRLWGPSRNPWAKGRTPGGSSGGSAAAVAAGIVPMAGANDGGGSIRIPASFCGLFGLKPSTGRISYGPYHGQFWEGAASEGVLSRSVRDAARMLDVLSGPESGDPSPPPAPSTPFAADVGASPGRLRIGFSTASPLGSEVDHACTEAVRDAAHLLESLGHHVEEAAPEIDGAAVADSYLKLYLGHVAAQVAASGARPSSFESDTAIIAMLGRALPSSRYVAAHLEWNGFARALGAFHERFDLWLLPTVAAPPARIGELDLPAWQRRILGVLKGLPMGSILLKMGVVDAIARESLIRTPFTQISNMTFTPSMSVPLAMAPPDPGEPAMPVGVQFVARYGEEGMLLRLAAQLEEAAPWAHRWPV